MINDLESKVMAKIVIPDFHPNDTDICDLPPRKTDNLLGGYIHIYTINDGGVNNISTTYEGAYNIHDNRFSSIDYSRSIRNWIYL